MSAQHMPGPWHIAKDMRGIGNQHVSGVCDMVGNAVANCGTNAEANARLIAATPDLLAALQRCAYALKDHCQYDDGEPSLESEAFNLACSAIAKATGG